MAASYKKPASESSLLKQVGPHHEPLDASEVEAAADHVARDGKAHYSDEGPSNQGKSNDEDESMVGSKD